MLITGINGFAGSHLAKLLIEEKFSVCGTVQPGTGTACLDGMKSKLKLVETEILDADKVEAAVLSSQPDYIFHLAGISHVPTSWKDPVLTCRINVGGTLNVVNATMNLKKRPRILLVSSGDVYGKHAVDGKTLRENMTCLPLNPYGASKAAAEMFAIGFAQAGKADIVIARPFNHIGAGQNIGFVTSDFANQIVRIEAGKQEPVIKVGDLRAYKDFTDVGDIVAAYLSALKKCESGKIYNIAGGKSFRISKILDMLIGLSGIDVKIVANKNPVQSQPPKRFKADSNLFQKTTDWKPKIDIERTLADILDYWRGVVKREK